ncbi:MAG: SRPBCC family protein [Ferruginibacter sp.]
MQHIHCTTFIAAPIERVFDLSRSINMHKISTVDTGEEAIAGTTTGLINLNETVTWRAKHLFKIRQFTSKITVMENPTTFTDEMLQGDFKSFKHEHHFKSTNNGCIMIDLIWFESPYGNLGKMVDRFYLKAYLEKFLLKRNAVIQEYAETEKWKVILR